MDMTDPTGGVKVATEIAQSQYVFSILFVLLLFVCIWVGRKMLDKVLNDNKAMEARNNSAIEKMDTMHASRQAQLELLIESNKQESREREAQLMTHNNTLLAQLQSQTEQLQHQTNSLEEITRTQTRMQESLEDLRDSFDKIEHRIEKIENRQQYQN